MATTSKKKGSAAAVEAPVRESTRALLEELGRWRDVHPALTALDQEMFEAKYPAAWREQLGGSTKARGTLKDAVAWLRLLHPAAGRKPAGDHGVAPVTMALFVGWTGQLLHAVEALDAGAADDHGVKLAAAREAANTLWRTTRGPVDEALGRNEAWTAQLREQLLGSRHGELDGDAARLLRLADAIDGWFKSKDAVVKHALTTEGVTAERAALCRQRANALEAARALAAGAKDTGRDPPPVNRVEGSVLALMQGIFRAVNGARANKATTLVLQPGGATRRIIQPNTGRAKSGEGETPAEGRVVAEGAAPTAEAATKPRKKRKKG